MRNAIFSQSDEEEKEEEEKKEEKEEDAEQKIDKVSLRIVQKLKEGFIARKKARHEDGGGVVTASNQEA